MTARIKGRIGGRNRVQGHQWDESAEVFSRAGGDGTKRSAVVAQTEVGECI
jgi:hypothetical protein